MVWWNQTLNPLCFNVIWTDVHYFNQLKCYDKIPDVINLYILKKIIEYYFVNIFDLVEIKKISLIVLQTAAVKPVNSLSKITNSANHTYAVKNNISVKIRIRQKTLKLWIVN